MQAQIAQTPAYPMSAPPPVSAPPYPTNPASYPVSGDKYANLYPVLDEYMGLQLHEHSQHVPPSNAVAIQQVCNEDYFL